MGLKLVVVVINLREVFCFPRVNLFSCALLYKCVIIRRVSYRYNNFFWFNSDII